MTAIEKAASDGNFTDISVPFTSGRVDATQADTDIDSFNYLRPTSEGFLNFGNSSVNALAEQTLIDHAAQLTLSPPELTVLIGGMRALGANYDGSLTGIFTSTPGVLTNDFFRNLLDINNVWTPTDAAADSFVAKDRVSGRQKYTASRNDLVFASQFELRAIAEVYGSADGGERMASDFAKAFGKVVALDLF